jgi:hypothetical protein
MPNIVSNGFVVIDTGLDRNSLISRLVSEKHPIINQSSGRKKKHD